MAYIYKHRELAHGEREQIEQELRRRRMDTPDEEMMSWARSMALEGVTVNDGQVFSSDVRKVSSLDVLRLLELAEAGLKKQRPKAADDEDTPRSAKRRAKKSSKRAEKPGTKPVTARTITDTQIKALRREAAEAGDTKQVRLCDQALAGKGGKSECAKAINDARAMED